MVKVACVNWPSHIGPMSAEVEEAFGKLNLTVAKTGIVKNNPFIPRMTIPQASEATANVFGANGLMVILENHMSQPLWCCSESDGNGFHGDAQFHPEVWLRGFVYGSKAAMACVRNYEVGIKIKLFGMDTFMMEQRQFTK
ncbi:hypothetical protein RCOM_1689350 [Ricinus communis]|uniref:Uncharacterized protein n=1 Tax=Ricinus communis TaxID=3988 RepID=B9RCJ2_RICCO|nr:hypothetical protein RCOM_1689350 [Ricinus communis]